MSARKTSPARTRTSSAKPRTAADVSPPDALIGSVGAGTKAARKSTPSVEVERAAKRGTAKGAAKKGAPKQGAPKRTAPSSTKQHKPALLSGGNPQIAKGDGDGPVQAYIAAMPDWKCALGARLDALIESAVPGVRKAVKWNSPFYGVNGQGWFLSFHCFAKYVKVAFLRGGSLKPLPPGESKHKETRYLDIHEADELDEAQLITWLQQSAALPGWDGGSPRLNGGIPL